MMMNSQTVTRKHRVNNVGSARRIHEHVERLFANRDYASKHHVQLRTTHNDADDHVVNPQLDIHDEDRSLDSMTVLKLGT